MRIHIAQPGDSLLDIAIRYQLSEEKILEANPHIEDPAYLSPGMKIRIPSGKVPVLIEKKKASVAEDLEENKFELNIVELLPTYVLPLELELADWVEESLERDVENEGGNENWREESYGYFLESYGYESPSSSIGGLTSSYPFDPYYLNNFDFSYPPDPSFWTNQAFYPPALPCSCSPNPQISYFPGFYPFQPSTSDSFPYFPSIDERKVDRSAEF